MGWVKMSERELNRVEVLAQVDDDRLSVNNADFGPTLAAEILTEHHSFKVSRETLRKWMQEDGIWLSHEQRRTFHQPRLHRECIGELIQIDEPDHRWFEDRGDPCTLARLH